MDYLPLYYNPKLGWVIDVPRAPTPQQMDFLNRFVREPKNLGVILNGVKHLDEPEKTKVVNDLISGKIQYNIRGDRMDGKGDIRLFEAPKPREREYSYIKKE